MLSATKKIKGHWDKKWGGVKDESFEEGAPEFHEGPSSSEKAVQTQGITSAETSDERGSDMLWDQTRSVWSFGSEQELRLRGRRGQITKSLEGCGKVFGFYYNSNGKPLESFKAGQ